VRGYLTICLCSLFVLHAASASPALASPPSPSRAAEGGTLDALRTVDNNRDDWRRTTRGWERKSNWNLHRADVDPVVHTPMPHPAAVTGLILLLSIGALVAFSPEPRGRRPVFVASRR
jgi:hypothetical protein